MGIALWSEPVAMIAKLGFIQRHEYLGNGLLDDPVHDRRDAQLPFLPVVLGYVYPANRIGEVFAPQYGPYQFSPSPDRPVGILWPRLTPHG